MDSSQVICSYCGSVNTGSDERCSHCGLTLESQSLSDNVVPAQPSLTSDDVLQNRYHILDVIGQGGMGIVYKAEDLRLGKRIVAVKEMGFQGLRSKEDIEQATKAFEQEALMLANLSHPFLPSIYDHFEDSRRWYLVMEYIPGETLSSLLKNTEGISSSDDMFIDEVLEIALKLCSVLGYLHSHVPPIIFSDLKPSNIMFTPEGDLYLIDFGIARIFQALQIDERRFVSPGYSAPEQYQRTQLSHRADIYSLGVTLYVLLSGRPPRDTFAPLELWPERWAVELESLIMKMVEQNEDARPQEIAFIKQVLQIIVSHKAQEQMSAGVWGSQQQNLGWGTRQALPPPPLTFGQVPVDPKMPLSVTYQEIQPPLSSIGALAWSPDGQRLAVGNSSGELQIWVWFSENKNLLEEPEVLSSWSLKEKFRDLIDKFRDPPTVRNLMPPTVPYYPDSCALAWSPDGTRLVFSASFAGDYPISPIIVLDASIGDISAYYSSHESPVTDIGWSPDGKYIASCGEESTVHVWDAITGRSICHYQHHSSNVRAIAWSSDSVYIASARSDGSVQVWQAATGSEVCQYQNHQESVYDVVWSPDGTFLVSCSFDHSIHIWDARTARQIRTLEGHTLSVLYIFFLNDGRLLASVDESTMRIWRTDTWKLVETIPLLKEDRTIFRIFPLGVCPAFSLVATCFGGNMRIWELDIEQLMGLPGKSTDVQYTNAKVVLVGDSGVGKSGLGLVLSRQRYIPTESTHGRKVWTFAKRESRLEDERKEVREILLWDLAGQPGYRLIHQLHLSEVAVALVVFDAHNESDPFAGIAHWVRALQTAQRVKGNAGILKKLLVLARMDRGGKRVSRGRIEELVQLQGFDGYFETSAKEGTNIVALAEAINRSIDWDMLPRVTSTQLFQQIRAFLLSEKQVGRLLSTVEDLERAFFRMEPSWNQEQEKVFSDQFVTCIGRVDAAGLIRQLSFGNLVLLQPELLDTYASSLVNAVRDEPDGLGSILEEKVRAGDFFVPSDERIRDPEQEKLLLIAMVEDLLHYEIVLREQGEDGAYLVFPSESTRENPALPNPENVSVVFTFEGPVSNIYATLAVRLSHSGLFMRKELWRNAITYTATAGGICGILLKTLEDGLGELTLFFDTDASEETRFYFEDYVRIHLQRKALPDSLERRRLFICDGCGYQASDQLIHIRRERGFNWFDCPGCGTRVWLLDREERLNKVSLSRVSEMDRAADVQRERATAQSKVQGKQEVQDFDVFLSYHSKDRESVIALGEQLKEEGLLPWLDVWELRPGLLWQDILDQQIAQIKSAVICIGKDSIGSWQQQEMAAFLREFVDRKCPVIPLLLSDAPKKPRLPVFLKGFTWVDFRPSNPDPFKKLVWGITGERNF